ncbi:MAG: hypothetical protein LAP38_22625 [Acidobacteriia bacterium]|nr:hypothetical protein [Terriglobia bacterium]
MKITAMVAMAAVAALSARGAEVSAKGRPVTVFISNEHAVPATNFAKDQAARMFARIGVTIEWRSAGRSALPPDAIVVDILEQSEASECAGALACAKPFEGVHIRVFSDRLKRVVTESTVPALLAHVLVHEITHILEGTASHSDSGIMKARWDTKDFDRMPRSPLAFTNLDVQLIQLGIATREAKLVASLNAPAERGPHVVAAN